MESFELAAKLLHERKSRRRWLVLSLCAAAILAVCVFMMFTTPIHAMTNQVLNCQLEVHTHTAACKDADGALICGQADYVVHTHSSDCYNDEDALICTLPVIPKHVHTSACYQQEKILVCQKEEAQQHTHTAQCYSQTDTLVCGQSEEEPHSHDERCYTSESVLACGLAEFEGHTHTDSCYTETAELTCDNEDEEHVHEDNCYTVTRTQTCGQQESAGHAHGDSCYQQRDVLSCGKAETAGHTHTSECYKTEEALTCGKPETEGHKHGSECYALGENTLVCGKLELHTHVDSCYTEVPDESGSGTKKILICKEIQLLEHVHDADCFEVVETKTEPKEDEEDTAAVSEPTDGGEPEGGKDSDDPVSKTSEDGDEPVVPETEEDEDEPLGPLVLTEADVTYKLYYLDENGLWISITNDAELAEHLNEGIRVDVAVKNSVDLSSKTLQAHNYQITYQLPAYFDLLASTGGKIMEGGTEAGSILCDAETNTALLVFNSEYVDYRDELLNLQFTVQGWFNLYELSTPGEDKDVFGQFHVEAEDSAEDFLAKHSTLALEKEVVDSFVVEEDGEYYVEYRLTVTAGRYGAPDVTVTDSAFKGIDYWQSRWFTKDGDVYTAFTETSSADSFVPGTVRSVAGGYTDGVWTDSALVWEIGDMQPDEVRTLTYRVHLDREYVDKSTSESMPNNAQITSKDRLKDSTNETVGFWASGELFKVTGGFVPNVDESGVVIDGSGTITYRIYVHAYENNEHVLDLILKDSLAAYLEYDSNHDDYSELQLTDPELLPYLHYDSIVIYEGDQRETDAAALQKLPPVTDERIVRNTPVDGGDTLEITFEDMEPDEGFTIVYTIEVDPEAFELYNGDFTIKNGANVNTQLLPDDVYITGRYVDSARTEDTVEGKKWVEKLKGKEQKTGGHISFGSADPVYDIHGGLREAAPRPEGFDYFAGNYLYTVRVNDGGVWDITSRVMTDSLTNKQHMAYVGYVKVTGTLTGEDGSKETKTVWVDVDGLTEFQFCGSDLGFSADAWVFDLTYYTVPTNMEGLASVTFGNSFSLGPGHNHNLPEIEVEVHQTITGTLDITGTKQAWYYDSAVQTGKNWSDRGALFWVLRIQASVFPDNLQLQDRANSGTGTHKLHRDSVIEAFWGDPELDIPANYADYEEFTAAMSQLDLIPLADTDYEIVVNGSTSSLLQINFLQTLIPPEGKALYFLVKSDPQSLPSSETGPLTFNNTLRSRQIEDDSEDGDWFTEGRDSITLGEPDGVKKYYGGIFSTSGDGYATRLNGDDGGAWENIVLWYYNDDGNWQNIDPGLYVTWLVKANVFGDLQGTYELVDTIPEGMELKSVAAVDIYRYNDYDKNVPVPETIDEDGWTEHRSPTSYLSNMFANWDEWYYYTNGDQVKWRVNWPEAARTVGGESNVPYTVSFLVTCRITDEDILLGFEQGTELPEKNFENTVDIFHLVDGQWDPNGSASADVDINQQVQLAKTMARGNDNIVTFTIEVNPLGQDLTNQETITIKDEMSANLELDTDSIRVLDAAGEEVEWDRETLRIVSEDTGTTMYITLPDDQILYVLYDVRVNAPPNTSVPISNVASYRGRESSEPSRIEVREFNYTAGGSVESTTTDIKIEKISQQGGFPLRDAEFTLTKVELVDGEYAEVTGDGGYQAVVTTDGKGQAVIETVEQMVIYRLEETQAPEGYLAREPIYFVIVRNTDEAEEFAEYPDLEIKYAVNGVVTFSIVNSRAMISGTKKFASADGKPLAPPEGEYSFGLYTKDADGNLEKVIYEDEHYVQTIVVTEDATADELKFTFEDLEPGKTYYVYELDDDGEPITGTGTKYLIRGAFMFEPSYDNDGIELDTDNMTGTVTVTNKDRSYFELPSSGGIGTTPIYVLGSLLVIGTGILLATKKRSEKRHIADGR